MTDNNGTYYTISPGLRLYGCATGEGTRDLTAETLFSRGGDLLGERVSF